MVDVNCRSVVELTHGLATRMSSAGKGGVVLFSSVVGFSGAQFSATYAATKGFVQSFAEGLAVELRPRGISVLSVAPVRSAPGSRRGLACSWARPKRPTPSRVYPCARWPVGTRYGRGFCQTPWVVAGHHATLGPSPFAGADHEKHDAQGKGISQ